MALVSGVLYNRMHCNDFNEAVQEQYGRVDAYDINQHIDEEFAVFEDVNGYLEDYELERLQQFSDGEIYCTPTRIINGLVHEGMLRPGNYIIEMGY